MGQILTKVDLLFKMSHRAKPSFSGVSMRFQQKKKKKKILLRIIKWLFQEEVKNYLECYFFNELEKEQIQR